VDLVNVDTRRRRFEAVAPAVIDAVRRYLARRTDPATADDVLSDTLLVCWRRIDQMPQDHLPWAYGVARLCLANADRSRRRQARLVARIATTDPPPMAVPGPGPADHDLTAALTALRAEDAELLRLWAWEDLTPAQIAVVLGISANAASIRLHRAKQRLRAELAADPAKTGRPGKTADPGKAGGLGKAGGPGKTRPSAGHEESTEGRRP
jgi:RNA polymerase sigma-70 factor, ECF subfamily